jgi:hypothetical protein
MEPRYGVAFSEVIPLEPSVVCDARQLAWMRLQSLDQLLSLNRKVTDHACRCMNTVSDSRAGSADPRFRLCYGHHSESS